MAPKIALITGGTAGVGLSMVQAMARLGTEVHFIGTNEARGQEIERSVNAEGNGTTRFIRLDLSSMAAIRAFAQAYAGEVAHLDVLANVAGLLSPERRETAEGLELTFAVDHLSAFLLSRELTPLLARAPHGRIVNVAGLAKQVLVPQLDFDDLQSRASYSPFRAAFRGVHAKTVLSQCLAERLGPQGIDVNSFHPGTVKSDLGRNLSGPLAWGLKLASPFLSSASRTGIYVASADELNGVTGQFFSGKKARPLAFEADYAERLWSASEALVDGVL